MVAIAQKNRGRVIPADEHASTLEELRAVADQAIAGLDHAVAKQYGAYREKEGVCERALFVIDRKGAITWSYCSPIAVNPGADGILDALEKLPKQEAPDGNAQSSSHAA
jgi:alkyl hydroperoxide reductase subunit AhpC